MADRLPLTDKEGEVRELTEEDFSHAVPFSAIPESLRAKLSALKISGKRKKPAKTRITVRPVSGSDRCFSGNREQMADADG